MRRFALRLAAGTAIAALLILVALASTDLPGDLRLYPPPSADQDRSTLYLVDYGFHTGIVLRRTDLAQAALAADHTALISVTRRFGAYSFLEMGWGDEELYRKVRTIADVRVDQALRALFVPGNRAVLHVVGVNGSPQAFFARAPIVPIVISHEGLHRVAARLEASFARDADGRAIEAGPGLFGPSLFYRAKGSFSVLNVCNHWTGRLLNAAGLPIAPILATLPAGLLVNLRWRSGLAPMSAPP
jgi:uncharacterized protein (TIGR02117 family)